MEVKTSDNYSIEWHINMIANRLDEAVGQWGLYFSNGELTLDDVRALRRIIDHIVDPAMRDAHRHEYNIQGYQFKEVAK